MNEVMDTIDQANAHEEFDRDLALRLFKDGAGLKATRDRVIEEFCQAPDCGEPIPETRRKANTATDILYCIDCQARLERTGRL